MDTHDITNTNVTGWFFKNHGSNDVAVIHTWESMDNCNINGTFIENEGFYSGVFYFNGYVNNSNIDGVYINNTAGYGGVDMINHIYNSNISGLFINNSAKYYYGGVHYLKEYNENCTFTGTYINNHAKLLGGVFYIKNGLNNTVISGSFSNNTAGEYGNTIYVMGSSRDEGVDVNLTIRDSVFSGTNPIYTDNDLVNNAYINLINNKELDNDGDYFIYNQYNLNLFNNTLTTVIYNKGNITSPTNITIRDNTTEKVDSSLVNLYAKILDDNNNYIVEDLFVFTINDAIFETTFNKEGFVDADYVLKEGYGIYIINSTMDSLKNIVSDKKYLY